MLLKKLMLRFKTLFILIFFIVVNNFCFPKYSFSDDIGNFSINGESTLIIDGLTPKKFISYKTDITNLSKSKEIYHFSIPSGYCNNKKYDKNSDDSDCKYNSTRAQIHEDVWKFKKYKLGQPKESWYGWYVFFPQEFPTGKNQVEGGYEFFYWHNGKCPNLTFWSPAGAELDMLYLATNVSIGGYDCKQDRRIPIIKLSDIRNRWARFEVFVNWSLEKDGKALVFLDDKLVVDYSGRTLTPSLDKINYFKFGIYLCCTKNYKDIKGMDLLISGVKRSNTRAGLSIKN